MELDEYAVGIKSKIEALGGCETLAELDLIYKESRSLLREYEDNIERSLRLGNLTNENVGPHSIQLSCLTKELHSTILNTRANLLKKSERARSQLLSSGRGQVTHSVPTSPSDSLAKEITADLQQMTKTLHDELLRSETSAKIFATSTRKMIDTSQAYTSLSGILRTSSLLIRDLWRRDHSERWIIKVSLIVYGIILLYVVLRRIWLLGVLVKWSNSLFTFLMKLLWSCSMGLFERVLRGEGRGSTNTKTINPSSLGETVLYTLENTIAHVDL